MSNRTSKTETKAERPIALDPRTVSRQMILERAGFRRPAASLVLFASDPTDAFLEDIAILHRRAEPVFQIVIAACAPAGTLTGRVKKLKQVAQLGRLPATTVIAGQSEPFLRFVNRTVSTAIGEIAILFFGGAIDSCDWLASFIEPFRKDPNLGVFECKQEKPSGGASLKSWRSAIAIRGDLWTALGGLEESYSSLAWSLRDFCMRSRAIGCAAPQLIRGRAGVAPASVKTEDRRRFRQRARSAPDRSGPAPANGAVTPSQMAVYTAITDCYDTLKPQPRAATPAIEFVAFLDCSTAAAHGDQNRAWRVIEAAPPTAEPHRGARFYKTNSHLVLPDKHFSLWVDASISITFPFRLTRLVELFLSKSDICVFRHHARRSIYEEAEACKERGLDRSEVIDAQTDRYRRQGLPITTGLAEVPVVLRRHTPAIRAFNEAWWDEISAGSSRDQLSFNYVAWKLDVSYATFPLSIVTRNGLFLKFRR